MIEKYFSESILEQIKSYALSDPVNEVCGLIVSTDDGDILIESENVSEDPAESFKVSSEAQLEAYSKGQIKALYHSHCDRDDDQMLSATDIRESKKNNIPYLLWHPSNVWDYYDPQLKTNPYPLLLEGDNTTLEYYLNWRWQWNRCDCWTLVRAYYKGILGIDLIDPPRPSSREIFRTGFNQLAEKLPDAGFQMGYGTPAKNDLVLMSVASNNPHHIGVMVSDTHFLHIYDENHPSEVIEYAGMWQQLTNSIWKFQE